MINQELRGVLMDQPNALETGLLPVKKSGEPGPAGAY